MYLFLDKPIVVVFLPKKKKFWYYALALIANKGKNYLIQKIFWL